jgi:chemotaxis response regulator CheB
MTVLYIVGIGGSAGSLEPLLTFFDHTPLDDASYIIVRHLPKDNRSELKNILERHSCLQIVDVVEGMRLEANKVYVGPSHMHMIIKEQKLQLVPRPKGPNSAIDLFLDSLAEEALEGKAIAVILSGAGLDGVKGAGAVKQAGGFVIAQDPISCEFSSIPQHTIESGVVDYVRVPAEMPALIQEYIHTNKNTIE